MAYTANVHSSEFSRVGLNHWSSLGHRKHFTARTKPKDVLERLRILSAVCKWRGLYDQSAEFAAEYQALKSKLVQSE